MSEDKLDLEEKEILSNFEAGKFKFVLTPERKNLLVKTAKEHFKKVTLLNPEMKQHLDF